MEYSVTIAQLFGYVFIYLAFREAPGSLYYIFNTKKIIDPMIGYVCAFSTGVFWLGIVAGSCIMLNTTVHGPDGIAIAIMIGLMAVVAGIVSAVSRFSIVRGSIERENAEVTQSNIKRFRSF